MTEARKRSRTDDAYGQLRAQIRANTLPPGHLSPEPEIAQRLGMSRTPVREALIRLEAEGLVELIPRRGARVLPLHADDMKDIYEILTALEPDAAAHLASRRPPAEELAPLDEATTQMEAALEHDDRDAWAEADATFHQCLLDLHGNRRLSDYVQTLYDQVHRARMITLSLRARPVQSTREHRDILEHLRAGNADATRDVFRRHRQRSARELLEILKTYRLPQL